MDCHWNENCNNSINSSRSNFSITRPPESSFTFLYNPNFDPFSHSQGIDMKHPAMAGADTLQAIVPGIMEKNLIMMNSCGNNNNSCNNSMDQKKKRLSTEQLESLERSFQEEIKLDPDRKMKLSKDLGLQPRQIAVWFQNRRARWKAKQLERLYDSLKQEYDNMSREKQKLQEEVLKLKNVLREQTSRKQISAVYTDLSGEETVESTSGGIMNRSCNNVKARGNNLNDHNSNNDMNGDQCNYGIFNAEDYNPISPPPFWAAQLPNPNYL